MTRIRLTETQEKEKTNWKNKAIGKGKKTRNV